MMVVISGLHKRDFSIREKYNKKGEKKNIYRLYIIRSLIRR